MDGLLDVLRQDKRYRKGEAKDVLLALFELLGDEDPLTRTYRSELASVLFWRNCCSRNKAKATKVIRTFVACLF